MAPRILIFSIAMGADYSFYVKSIATFALTFFGHIISVLASMALYTVAANLSLHLKNGARCTYLIFLPLY